MNRFQRLASKHSYYGYLKRYDPEMLRTYQSERHWLLGRRGAYDTLVYKMSADHVGMEEDFNMTYKVPPIIANTSMRVAWFLFLVPMFMMMFNFDDMVRIFQPHKYYYSGNPSDDGEAPARYETMYMVTRLPKF